MCSHKYKAVKISLGYHYRAIQNLAQRDLNQVQSYIVFNVRCVSSALSSRSSAARGRSCPWAFFFFFCYILVSELSSKNSEICALPGKIDAIKIGVNPE